MTRMSAPDLMLSGSVTHGMRARLSAVLRQIVRPHLERIEAGTLTVILPLGIRLHHRAAQPGPDAVLVVRRWRALSRTLLAGDLGLARAYMEDEFRSPDLASLLAFGVLNQSGRSKLPSDVPPAQWLGRIRHARRANTRRGSRRNVAAHYDLGNDFYARWLDRGMNYSSALFTRPDQTLEQAQDAKLDRVIALLDVVPGQRILEIGCGWGPVSERLAAEHDCRVTGITLSAEQLDFARARLARSVSSHSCDLRLQDYRDVDGRYDRIVSIEMLEAVGERFWPVYFAKLRQSLTDAGTAVLQVITIAEERFTAYRRRPDFIQRYIFPGGMLPTPSIVRREAERAGLRVVSQEPFGASYARTLNEWRRRFLAAWPQIERLGFDGRFKRMWEYYLTYCEIGFQVGAIDVSLIKLVPAR